MLNVASKYYHENNIAGYNEMPLEHEAHVWVVYANAGAHISSLKQRVALLHKVKCIHISPKSPCIEHVL